MKDLKCPFCKGDLTITHQDNYQDLLEHVSQPNAKPSLKDGYECLNNSCLALDTFSWIEDGDYYSQRPEGFNYREWSSLQKESCPSENYYAIGSWNYFYKVGKDAIKAKTFKIDLHYYKFVFSPKEKGSKYPDEIQYMPDTWNWKIEIWKKSSDYGYTNLIPFWKMTSYCLGQFKRAYKNWKEDGNATSLKAAYCTAHSLSEWDMLPDARFYSKLTSFLIHLFQPAKVRSIDNAMQKC